MADNRNTKTAAEFPPSARPEGVTAAKRGEPRSANPYIRGKDQWAWDQGWLDWHRGEAKIDQTIGKALHL